MRMIKVTMALVAAAVLALGSSAAFARSGGGHGGAHFSGGGGGAKFGGYSGGGGARIGSFNGSSRSVGSVTRFGPPRAFVSSQRFASHVGNNHRRHRNHFVGSGFYPGYYYDDYPYAYDSYYAYDYDDDVVCYWSERRGRRICRPSY